MAYAEGTVTYHLDDLTEYNAHVALFMGNSKVTSISSNEGLLTVTIEFDNSLE